MNALDHDDLRELRAAFLVQAPQRAARIRLRLDALEQSDSAAARGAATAAAAREAHTLQGSAGTVGFADLASLAGQLDEALRNEPDVETARGLADEIAAAIVAAEREVNVGDVSLTVLHVEDDELSARLVERVVARRRGTHLLAATHGETAVELARERLPGLILLDLNLPDMSGVEVLRRLRDDPRTRDLEVVVVTGHDAAQTSERLHDLRVRECLPKPIVVARLLELLDEVGEADAGPA